MRSDFKDRAKQCEGRRSESGWTGGQQGVECSNYIRKKGTQKYVIWNFYVWVHNNQLTPLIRILLEELIVFSSSREIPHFLWNRSFIKPIIPKRAFGYNTEPIPSSYYSGILQ